MELDVSGELQHFTYFRYLKIKIKSSCDNDVLA